MGNNNTEDLAQIVRDIDQYIIDLNRTAKDCDNEASIRNITDGFIKQDLIRKVKIYITCLLSKNALRHVDSKDKGINPLDKQCDLFITTFSKVHDYLEGIHIIEETLTEETFHSE